MSDKSGIASQVISLPTGGGAVQGIGEAFAPDLFTGTGNLSVPIALPPGRNRFEPELALTYSTGNGNGPCGFGWMLGASAITRKTSKGVPRYRGAEAQVAERDTFLLAGADDLVPVEETATRTLYRPRTEGLFARIEHHHTALTDHWEVRSVDGVVSTFGTPGALGADPAAIADPARRERVFTWHLTALEDPFRNRIRYEYERDSGETADHHWDQLYLSRIRYVDVRPELASPRGNGSLVSVTLRYAERPDPFSNHRAGFEIRTRLRCTSIEIATHAAQDRLARVYHLVYLDQLGLPPHHGPANGVSLLSRVEVEGRDGPRRQTLPPLEFRYTGFEPAQRRFRPMEAVGRALPERSLAHPEYELVDLFGTGLPDVIQMNGTVRYWRNLGGGTFDAPRSMAAAPAGVHLADRGVQLADLNGDGRADLLVTDGTRGGYYPLGFEGAWDARGFVPYRALPSVDLDAPDLRLVDLDGDGVTDALRTATSFELYYQDPRTGWETVDVRPRRPLDEFPNVSFTDPWVRLADFTGDGLQDIVLIHNGRVDYWPYQGHGRWGRRVTMRDSPRFDDAAFFPGLGFDPDRVLVGDVDGDGLADLLYVSDGTVTLWINQGGDGWSAPIHVPGTPPFSDVDAVRLADMLGLGTSGLLWTYDQHSQRDSTYKFLDFIGGVKPYLLHEVDNGTGALTRVRYAPSTDFYRADAGRAETRWRAPLPFPVQVVAQVEAFDLIARSKLTTEYRYHHGYWDGNEREFRGFGLVEQLDSESFGDYHRRPPAGSGPDFASVEPARFSLPIRTRTWFHLGDTGDPGLAGEPDYQGEFWPGDPPALSLPHADLPDDLSGRARRAALRSLRGLVLRTELYADDGGPRADRPFAVTEGRFAVREEAPPQSSEDERERIFFPHLVAQRITQWERGDDPMTRVSFIENHDAFGQPCRRIEIAVPRHRDYRVQAEPGEPYLATLQEVDYAGRDDAQRLIADRVARVTQFAIPNDGTPSAVELAQAIRDDLTPRRILSQVLTYYDGDPFRGLPFGRVGDFGAAVRSEALVLTDEVLDAAFPDLPPYLVPGVPPAWTDEYPVEFRDRTPPLAGYTFHAGGDEHAVGYFAATSRLRYDVQTGAGRGMLLESRDPLDRVTGIEYDAFDLLPVIASDGAGLATRAEYDYRLFLPVRVEDSNGNRSTFTYTPLGLLASVARAGRDGAEGDPPDQPGLRLSYDLLTFLESGRPVSVRTVRRLRHAGPDDPGDGEADRVVRLVEYSDGFGRVIQTRSLADDLLFGDPQHGAGVLSPDQMDPAGSDPVTGRLRPPERPPNVIVSGLRMYNNKGWIVEQHEPFFDQGFDYAEPPDAGVRSQMFYDPRGQMVRTVRADGSEQRSIFGVPTDLADPDEFVPTPWEQFRYDVNDNAGRTHPDQSVDYQSHWNTPNSRELDALGRTVRTVERNGSDSERDWFVTEMTYDLRGNLVTVTDALGREAFRYAYDHLDHPLRVVSADGGVERTMFDASGRPVEFRSSQGALRLHAYDRLARPVRLWARDDGAAAVTLRELLEYGDAGDPQQPPAEREAQRRANRLGRLHRRFDEAGLLVYEVYDFKGNLEEKVRRVIGDAALLPNFVGPVPDDQAPAWRADWSPPAGHTLDQHAAAMLGERSYPLSASYDALDRPVRLVYPPDGLGERLGLLLHYSQAGTVDRVELADGNGQVAPFVVHAAHDARRNPTLVALGNGVMTRYAYDRNSAHLARTRSERYTRPDPVTFVPVGAPLQDTGYAHDLAGNLLRATELVPGCGVRNHPDAGQIADPQLRALVIAGDALVRRFGYDPLYRLVTATGRACQDRALAGNLGPEAPPWCGFNSFNLGAPNQDNAPELTAAYRQTYTYDGVGNLRELRHSGSGGAFVRHYTMAEGSNRLASMRVGNDDSPPIDYSYDASGNLTGETTSRHFGWDHGKRLKDYRTQAGDAEPSVELRYLYDSAGQRVKKLVRRQGGSTESVVYLDGIYEHHSWRDGSGQGAENHLVHVVRDSGRDAVVRRGPAHPEDRGPDVQYHLSDPLNHSTVVIGGAAPADAGLISREEFTPYGETGFGSFARKRYRFAGKERDEESGLDYFGVRYYASWTARWISCDPAGPVDGPNLYRYARNRPSVLSDPSGAQAEPTGIRGRGSDQFGTYWYYHSGGSVRYRDGVYSYYAPNSSTPTHYLSDGQWVYMSPETIVIQGKAPGGGSSFWTRVWGGVKVVGGVIEAKAGAALMVVPGGQVLGVVLVVHGADTAASGARQVWTGKNTRTLTSEVISEGAELVGADEETARDVGEWGDAAIGVGGGVKGALMLNKQAWNAPRAFAETAETAAAHGSSGVASSVDNVLFELRGQATELTKKLGTMTPQKFGSVNDAIFKSLVKDAVEQGRLPSTIRTSPASLNQPGSAGIDVWDSATGTGWDLTTPTQASVIDHDMRYLNQLAPDGTLINDVRPLLYFRF